MKYRHSGYVGGACREAFSSSFRWVHSKDGSYDIAVRQEDSDDAASQNTATKSEQHNLIDGCVWGGEG